MWVHVALHIGYGISMGGIVGKWVLLGMGVAERRIERGMVTGFEIWVSIWIMG